MGVNEIRSPGRGEERNITSMFHVSINVEYSDANSGILPEVSGFLEAVGIERDVWNLEVNISVKLTNKHVSKI